jgi:hypothetical protein
MNTIEIPIYIVYSFLSAVIIAGGWIVVADIVERLKDQDKPDE